MNNKPTKTVDVSDLPDPNDQATPPDEEGDGEVQDQLPEDVAREMERCKTWQAKRNANKPGAPKPQAFYIQVCEEHIVCAEWTLEQWERLVKISTGDQRHKAGRQLLTDTLFWMRGQTKPGPQGALEHLKTVTGYGGAKAMIWDKAAGLLMDQVTASAGEDIVKKR